MDYTLNNSGEEPAKKETPGRLIVFEGLDGSGKSTQIDLLKEFLTEKGISFAYFKFPRHGQDFFGKMVDLYLGGSFGNPTQVNSYQASLLYSLDRREVQPQLVKALREKDLVLVDRYTGSNLAHQMVKIVPKSKWKEFIEWMEDLEYEKLKLPRPDKVLYFAVPFKTNLAMLKNPSRTQKLDGHEKDQAYLLRVKEAYDELAQRKQEWEIIQCGEGEAIMKKNQIALKVRAVLEV